jgi:dTMP kinase
MIRLALEKRLVTDFETLQLMFSVDRADHISSKRGISERLEKGEVVISDRFMASTIAFGHASGLDSKWLAVMQSKFYMPDKTYFLDVNPEVSLDRIRKSRPGFDLFEEKERLEKVRDGYALAFKILKGSGVKVINGEQDREKITKEIISDIEKSRKYKSVLKFVQEELIDK